MNQEEIILLDSSFLISLAKIDGLSVLEIFKKQTGAIFLVPQPVYRECVVDGINDGYLDAFFIKNEFEKGIIATKEIDSSPKLPVDECLIESAEHWCVKEILVDDELLLKKIARKGLSARRSIEFLRDQVKIGNLSKEEYLKYIARMVERKRLSKDKRNLYEEV